MYAIYEHRFVRSKSPGIGICPGVNIFPNRNFAMPEGCVPTASAQSTRSFGARSFRSRTFRPRTPSREFCFPQTMESKRPNSFKGEIKIAFKFCVHKIYFYFFLSLLNRVQGCNWQNRSYLSQILKNFAQTRKLWEIDFLKKGR